MHIKKHATYPSPAHIPVTGIIQKVETSSDHKDYNRTTRSHPEASRRRHPAAANGSVDGRKLYYVKVLVDASDVDRVYEVSNPSRSFTTKHESIACLTDADCSFQLATADQVLGNFMGNLPHGFWLENRL
ncbi:hypothetical protein Tco_1112248 [Tanacetum coccineum]|uniref:Uncharacterized protein n=1 Tax=Tanacetum coccineum TaxID=301880 RepID=A0ABQ5IQ94_9ASTR